jgi:predicted dehydrogenase
MRLTAPSIVRSALSLVLLFATSRAHAQAPTDAHAPLRVVLAGLAHDHAYGFFDQLHKRQDVVLVGIAESDHALTASYASRYGLEASLFHDDLDELLTTTHPQAVLGYGSTLDHRRVVEIAARHGVPVMVEKPLAVSLADGVAIQKAARDGRIHVLVNYETTWYRSNRAAYDLVHDGSIGDVRKVVVHDGHKGPREIGVSPAFFAWLTDPEKNGGGALYDFGCYGADLTTWLMDGRRPDLVSAITQRIKPEVYPRVDDEATIVLTYPKAQAILQASWNWPFGRKDMEVYGRTGQVIAVDRDTLRLRLPEKDEQILEAKALPAHYADSLSYLKAVVVDGLAPEGLSSLEINMVVTEILDAARRSALTGKVVPVAAEPRPY